MHRCPVCGGQVDPGRSATVPFCGERCRTIDMGRWLGECYGLPEPARDLDEEGEEPVGGEA